MDDDDPVIPFTELVEETAVPVGPPDAVEFPVGKGAEAETVLLEVCVDPMSDPGVLISDPGGDETEVYPGGVLGVAAGPDVVTPVPEMVPAVPVGPALATVELGSGNGAELNRVEDGPGRPVPKPDEEGKTPVPPLPVGAGILEFDSGYGGLLLGRPGPVPVPANPELRGTEVPALEDVGTPVTVWFVKGNGAEVLELAGAFEIPVPEPVAKLVGAVTPPVVGKAQVLELDQGKGGLDEVPGRPVEIPVPDGIWPVDHPVPPVGPAAEPELLNGKGGMLVADNLGRDVEPVPNPALPVGPAVGPPAKEELLIGKGGNLVDVGELPVPCMLVPNGPVPVGPGPRDRLEELEKGNGAELEWVAEMGIPVPVPVPNAAVEELLNGNGALAVLLMTPPVPVPQDGETAVGPAAEVELDKGNGAVEGEGTPVRDVTPVPGAVPVGPTPVELPAEYGGDEDLAVPPEDAELDTPVPEGAQDVPVGRKPVECKAEELDNGNGTDDAPVDVGAVPGTEPPPVPVPVVDEVPLTEEVPLTDAAVEFAGTVVMDGRVSVLSLTLTGRVTVKVVVPIVTVPLTM